MMPHINWFDLAKPTFYCFKLGFSVRCLQFAQQEIKQHFSVQSGHSLTIVYFVDLIWLSLIAHTHCNHRNNFVKYFFYICSGFFFFFFLLAPCSACILTESRLSLLQMFIIKSSVFFLCELFKRIKSMSFSWLRFRNVMHIIWIISQEKTNKNMASVKRKCRNDVFSPMRRNEHLQNSIMYFVLFLKLIIFFSSLFSFS